MLSIHPPPPTGPYGIIRQFDVLVDGKRLDPHSPLSKRRLALDIWLPVHQNLQLVPYDERAIRFWKEADFWSENQKIELDDQLLQFGEYLSPGKSMANATESLPVVIFSHGFGAWASFYSYIIEEIVSHGIVVVGINHTYNAGIAEFPDQTIYGRMTHFHLFKSKYAHEEQITWLQDLESVIEKIKTSNDVPYNLMNANQVVVMGQSFGGSTAIHACCKIPDLKGCIDLDGALFGDKELFRTLSPLLILLGGDSIKSMKDKEAINDLADKLGITIDQANDFKECYFDRLDHITENNSNICKIILDGADHMAFTDFIFLSKSQLFSKAPIGTKDRNLILLDIRKCVMNFLKPLIF